MRGPINEHAPALAREWRRLTRAATAVALITAPAFFLVLYDSDHLSLAASLIITVLAVVMFRGLIEVIARKLIPSPSLYGAEESLKAEDIVARRRYWYWRGKFRRLPVYVLLVLLLLALCQVLFAFAGVSASFFHPFAGLRQIFPPDTLPQLALVFVQLPLLLFINVFILFGPFLFMAVRGIRSYEPGDASWGVKIDDVRGQAEAKEEITRVITLWQSGEEFEQAGGKRERGLLFLGAPGTGKTMISKAIATNFNCPFVTIPGSGFAQMFMGMDALVVQFLAFKARSWPASGAASASCSSTRSTLSACAARPSRAPRPPAAPSSIHDLCFFGPNGSLTPTGDLVIETRAWREQLFAQPGAAAARRLRAVPGRGRRAPAALPPGDDGRLPGTGAQPAAGGDGRDRRAAGAAQVLHQPRSTRFLDAMFVVPSKLGPVKFRLAAAAGPARADLLHRRVQRADRRARSGPHPPGPDGPPHLVPHADQGRPGRHLRPLPRARSPTSPTLTRPTAATSWPGSPTATRRR